MKKASFLVFFLLMTGITVFTQVPESFNYQAVIRDESGQLIKNQNISVRITILQGSANGSVVYTETFSVTSNDYGMISIAVGEGDSSDDFSSIDWQSGPYFLRIAVDPAGGTSYTEMGTVQLLSVPYALHAKTAGNVFSGSYDDLTDKPDLSAYLTSETDPQVGDNNVNYFAKWDGTSLVSGDLYDSGQNIGTALPFMAQGGISTGALTLQGVTRTSWNRGETGRIPFWATRDSLGLTGLYFRSGKTGIGTSTPAFALDVAGSGRFSDTLFAGKLLTIGNMSPWQLCPAADSLFSVAGPSGKGSGLLLKSGETNLGGIYADTSRHFSLFDNNGITSWFTDLSSGTGGNINLKNGSSPTETSADFGKIEFARHRFYLTVPDNALNVISFRVGTENVASLDRGGVLSLSSIRDNDNTFYHLDPSGNSMLLNLTVMSSLTATNITATKYLDPDNSAYWVNPSESSHLNDLYVSKIYDLDNNVFYVNPDENSFLNQLSVNNITATSLMSCTRFTDTDNSNYYLDPSKGTYLYDLMVKNTTGLGGPPDTDYTLYVYGKAISTGGWSASDVRWKKDISPLGAEMNKVMSLQPVHYYWKKSQYPGMGFDDKQHIGLIAQKVEKVFPELVNTDAKGYKAVSYEKLTVVLLKAIQEQQKMIEQQQKNIEDLKRQVAQLKK